MFKQKDSRLSPTPVSYINNKTIYFYSALYIVALPCSTIHRFLGGESLQNDYHRRLNH